ncbi:hypothetical protein ACKFKF_15485 [Phormidesmis sp. 146-12]
MTVTNASTGLYLPNPDLVKTATAAIDTFEQSSAPSKWVFLDKATIIREMRSRVSDPFQINQGGQPFCGPAAVLFELVRKQPLRYVQICQSLFESGGLQATTRWISASDNLRQASRGDLKMGQADWMVLATLRESENLLFPVEPNAPEMIRNIAGMTKSWEMRGWIREILGYRKSEYYHAYLMNDVSALNQGAIAIQSGGVALMLVTAEGMLQNNPPPIPFPSHWVVLLGGVAVGERVSFDLYTWSKKLHLDIDLPSFKKYFWASVTGTP